MPEYTVAADQDLKSILAASFPNVSEQAVVDDPKNKALFARRTPTVLRAGDRIYIPEPDAPPKSVTVASGKEQRFVAKRPERNLVLKLRDAEGKALANLDFTVSGGPKPITGTTDGQGTLRATIPVSVVQCTIEIGGRSIPVRVGGLDPITTTRGVQSRLRNLGYPLGAEDDQYGTHTSRAIAAFQRDEGLTVDGHMTPETRDALESKYRG
jgi:hypothetical protein